MGKICVLGSLNIDLVITTEKLPTIGETIHGIDADYLLGGKGANQAVAASRMGDATTLIGCIGSDTFGEKITEYLQKEKMLEIDTIEKMNTFTGIATVFNLPKDNAIVVIPGANSLCSQEIVEKNREKIENSSVLLCQLEIPLETVDYAFDMAKKKQVTTILNPAPFAALPEELLEKVDYITPNDSEFEGLFGKKLSDETSLEQAMLVWEEKHRTKLIVTRGSKGCSYIMDNQVITLPTIDVEVTDTTGAGDTFNGILAYGLSNQLPIEESIRMASIGASLSIRKLGAQTGMPTLTEIKNINIK